MNEQAIKEGERIYGNAPPKSRGRPCHSKETEEGLVLWKSPLPTGLASVVAGETRTDYTPPILRRPTLGQMVRGIFRPRDFREEKARTVCVPYLYSNQSRSKAVAA